jgi:DNA polymerase elongation subunit (family B)
MLTPTELHGMVIDYNQIKKLPKRDNFLDQAQRAKVNDIVRRGDELLFMPNAVHEMHLQDKKYDKSHYSIVLFGVLKDGRNATVSIGGIKPFFEVMLPNGTSDEAVFISQKLKQLKYGAHDSYEIIKSRPFKGYHKERKTFARFYFKKLKMRKEAIKFIREQGYETTADDLNSYYRVVCRDYKTTFSEWTTLNEYTVREYSSIRGPVYRLDIANYQPYEGDVMSDPVLSKDNTMSMCWDIETYSPDGRLPRPEYPDHVMFMIGLTFQWYHSNNQLLRVCLVEHPCTRRPNYLTIVCGSEKKIIKAWAKIVFKMKPGLVLGFNDADYDWPWVIKRAMKYPGTLAFIAENFDRTRHWQNYDDENVLKYNFKKEKVKIEADAYAEGYTLVFPGYINIDVRTMFRQLYPTAEKSGLNFYLKLNKLSGKKDMPYQEMFQTYGALRSVYAERHELWASMQKFDGLRTSFPIIETYLFGDSKYESLVDRMGDIADYCVIDSQRCHELMKIRSVIMDKRGMAHLSYTSVFDAVYRANGMKVRNIVIADGQDRGLRFSNITNSGYVEDGKYPGAYVFPPKKGLVISKAPITFRKENASLPKYAAWATITDEEMGVYHEVIATHGPCPQKNVIDDLRSDCHKCFLDFLHEPTGRPITGLDFSSLYPSLIMTYNLSPEYIITDKATAMQADLDGHTLHKIKFTYNGRTIRGWSIRHDNKIDETDANCKFGIYPMILKKLFDKRKLMKKDLHTWESKKEDMDALSPEIFNLPETKALYEDVCFRFNYINSKQKALKVFMNTFYGESGNKRSPFFVIQLAGAITTSGQENIKLVQQYVEDAGCNVYYGDTDSIYSTMPERHFLSLDRKYYTNQMEKTDYWSEMVNLTFSVIGAINTDVNNMLIADNGTKFLRMAYEEALFPCAFLAKKKYYGIPHISKPNFHPKNLFIRGLEVKKRGVSDFLRKVCMDIMWDSVSLTNFSTLIELVEDKISYIFNTEWAFDDFIMTDVYKPTKQNVKVQTFAKRMFAIGVKVKPYERFRYVIVKKNPFKYDERGRKKALSVGEKMEYADRAAKENMKIDMDYYMRGSINGQLSRLVTYMPMFHVEPLSEDDDDLKIAEDKIYKNASKYIDNYCKQYYTDYASKGSLYQKIFKIASNAVIKRAKSLCGSEMGVILGSSYDPADLESWLEEKTNKKAMRDVHGYGIAHVNSMLVSLSKKQRIAKLKELQDTYFGNKGNNISTRHEVMYRERQDILRQHAREHMTAMVAALNRRSAIIGSVSQYIKDTVGIDTVFNQDGAKVPKWNDYAPIATLNQDTVESKADTAFKAIADDAETQAALRKMRYIYINMVSNAAFIHKTRATVDYLKRKLQVKLRLSGKPKDFNVITHIKANVEALVNN